MLRIKIIDSDFFKNNAILVSFEILPLVPTAELCASLMETLTVTAVLSVFLSLEIGNQYFSPVSG